jgi:hypothetical protein
LLKLIVSTVWATVVDHPIKLLTGAFNHSASSLSACAVHAATLAFQNAHI